MGQHEVIVVGAGPAGAALAYYLARQGRDVVLLDKASFPRDKTCGDGLTPRALGVLANMGVLEQVTAAGYLIHQMHFYAPDGTRVALGVPAWGSLPRYLAVLPRYQLDHLILKHALQAGAQFRPGWEAVELLRDGDLITGVAVRSDAGRQELHGRYVVMATGAATGLLERAGLQAGRWQMWRAARGYYKGVAQLQDAVEIHLETAALPGYAWVFPTSPSDANVGAAYLAPKGRAAPFASPRQVVDKFVAYPTMAERLATARLSGNLHGYPIRFDFASTPVAYPGLMLIGETAGLVNPLTGEGIDFALESAEVTAETLGALLRQPSKPAAAAAAHTRALRSRFQRTFVTIRQVRDVYLHAWLLNRAARVANHNDEFGLTIAQVLLGYIDPARWLAPKTLLQLAWG